MKKWTAILALLLIVAMVVPVSAGPVVAKKAKGSYIVRMEGPPLAAYEGDVKGMPATKPGKGGKINPNSAHAKKYTEYLEDQPQRGPQGRRRQAQQEGK